ncbi:MAG TPA: Ku protein, partial [Firmicutes bacterium]|nr:Ku protein [Candidatus Fermentithermobacillaceae bacterium]
MRPIWNGTLAFGLVVIPVKLYAATQRQTISFRLLHSACNSPVKYQKWCSACSVPLEPGDIVRGYEYEKGRYVVLTEEELDAVPGPDAHKVEILDFVNLADVDPVLFEKSYFLEPREGAEKAYRLLLESMRQQGKVAVARVALRARETLAVVRTYQDRFIMLETMYWADEVRSGQELKVPEETGLDER